MSGLDRIRVPADQRWQFSLIVAVVVVLALMLSASWWMGAPLWKLLVSAGVSAALGWMVAQGFVRWTRR